MEMNFTRVEVVGEKEMIDKSLGKFDFCHAKLFILFSIQLTK